MLSKSAVFIISNKHLNSFNAKLKEQNYNGQFKNSEYVHLVKVFFNQFFASNTIFTLSQ